MENTSKNTLEQLQAQYDILKHKFDTQQIVDPEMIFSLSRAKMQKLQDKYRTNSLFMLFVGILLTVMMFVRHMASIWFCIAFGIFINSLSIYWLRRYRNISRTSSPADLLTSVKNYKSLFKTSRLQKCIIAPIALILLVWMEFEFGHFSVNDGSLSVPLSEVFFLVFLFVVIIVINHVQKKKQTTLCDDIIQSLSQDLSDDDASNPQLNP